PAHHPRLPGRRRRCPQLVRADQLGRDERVSIRIRFTTAGGDVEDVPLLPTVIREQEQEHGKPWSEIVTLSSEWAFYGAWRYMQLRRDEGRSLDKWLESIDDLQVGR